MSSWQRLWHLTFLEVIWLTQAAIMLPAIRIALHVLGWQRLMRLLDRSGQDEKRTRPAEQTLEHAQRAAYITNAAARHGLVRATCLERSIVLWWLLLRQGIRSRVVLASCKGQLTFRAHAWVEYHSIVLNDRSDVRQDFVVIADF